MADRENEAPFPQASLGVVSTGEGLKRVDGAKAEMSRGCPACNREEGRSSASLKLDVELPLERESSEQDGAGKAGLELTIDYCPRCGRLYDVRCAAR